MSVMSTMSGYVTRPIGRIMPMMIALAATAILIFGWIGHGEEYLTPRTGLGYWLGIYGSTVMLLMLVYSVRKRFRFPGWFGSIPFWFRTHMLLGVIGPVLILFHANFTLGALNSNVALFTMLTVACSGVVGRYLYRKVHSNLSGHKGRIKELLANAESLKKQLGDEFLGADRIVDELNAFGQRVEARSPRGVLSSLLFRAHLAFSTRLARGRLIAEARRVVRRETGWSRRERRRRLARITDLVRLYFDAVLRAAEYTIYERLFALWHFLHLPLFVVMILAGVVHVWAVHRY